MSITFNSDKSIILYDKSQGNEWGSIDIEFDEKTFQLIMNHKYHLITLSRDEIHDLAAILSFVAEYGFLPRNKDEMFEAMRKETWR